MCGAGDLVNWDTRCISNARVPEEIDRKRLISGAREPADTMPR